MVKNIFHVGHLRPVLCKLHVKISQHFAYVGAYCFQQSTSPRLTQVPAQEAKGSPTRGEPTPGVQPSSTP